MKREKINFIDRRSNSGIKRQGFKVGTHLAVAFADDVHIQIFNIKTGLPFVPVLFQFLDDALKVADWLSDIFGETIILSEQPEYDLFSMVKWTIPNGIALYETMKLLNNAVRPVTLSDVAQAYNKGLSNVTSYTRYFDIR